MTTGTGLELILNAAEGALQMVVTEDETLLCAQEWRRPERATEILAPALRHICAALDLRLADFRRLACVRGPGSFTGIRLVLATAAALRRTGQVRLAGLDYLQALAATLAVDRGVRYGAPIWVLTHARRNLVHCQPYRSYGPLIPPQPLRPVDLCTPEAAAQRIAQSRTEPLPPGTDPAPRVWVCGSGLIRNAPLADALQTATDAPGLPVSALPDLTCPSVTALRLLARHGDYFAKDVEPLYVRPCDAVENLPGLAPRLGLDPAAAVTSLAEKLDRAPQSEI
ncbi:tRNA (adenosine(37)-N6)-threonylcarbamoyltransferase complex dimerization subunit type 1 TsaB [Desulfovibrio legallii]|uniref:tRNA (adenosine(37)-N6)-threonylcarbamoyltransferase complex dimerization subunit type 1 TsaB n=1 Tax=Desulfovibrio legallii TaxID=571438 RepID=UPI000E47A15E|nr:tRNA (adenosine(37)-N6)-threonylcarbamoyltransferase complex dimerization subunit type 1 TsaB [Desulfovibrio legallii]RHH23531.1 tRNA (adenosine(37)-N6)-threonylcarbamoyltransferase complex dimerization subunit type 1 TsaB [Desulfovibrio sp. AM18-2]